MPAVVHDFEQQLLAGAEEVLDRTPRDTRAARDLVRARLVVALLQNALDRRLQDARACRFAVGSSASRFGRRVDAGATTSRVWHGHVAVGGLAPAACGLHYRRTTATRGCHGGRPRRGDQGRRRRRRHRRAGSRRRCRDRRRDRSRTSATCARVGREEIDADGLLVTPGWVDVHTHYDGQVTWDPLLTPSSWQGVTTVVMGNCGVGFAPVRRDRHDFLIRLMEGVEDIPGHRAARGNHVGMGELPRVPRRDRQHAPRDRLRRAGCRTRRCARS